MRFKANKSARAVERAKTKRDEVLKLPQTALETWIDETIQEMDDVRSYLKRLTRAVKVNIRFE